MWFISRPIHGETTFLFAHFFAGNRSSKARVCFAQLLEDDEMAFDNLFCVAFQMLDAQWLARRASYMEFNVSVLYIRYVLRMLMVSCSITLYNRGTFISISIRKF
jgi:hypothetical protein